VARSGVSQHSRRRTGRASHPRTFRPDRRGKGVVVRRWGRIYRRERDPPTSAERDFEVQLVGPCLGEFDCRMGSRDGKPGHRRGSGQGIQGLDKGHWEDLILYRYPQVLCFDACYFLLFVKWNITDSCGFFCRVPLGPPKIKKRSKNGLNAY
jgi:hypothetical protein